MIRDLKFDNLRGFAIILIVLGHFIEETKFFDFFEFNFTYRFLYLFHLPLLIFISGYFSKDSAQSSTKAFKTVFIPYLIFDTLWIMFTYFQTGIFHYEMYFIPAVGLWYLLSLYFWRLFLPTANKIKHIFLISIILALIIGLIDFKTGLLSISRTFCFFPLFILGFYFKDLKEKFTLNKYAAAGILLTMLTATTLYLMPITTNVLFFKRSYHSMHLESLEGMIIRLLVMVVGIISVILLFNIMTSKKTFLTKIGRNSLAVYVLQFYFIFTLPYIINYLGLNFIFQSYLLTTIYVISATALVTFLLSREKVKEVVDKLILTVTKILIKENVR